MKQEVLIRGIKDVVGVVATIGGSIFVATALNKLTPQTSNKFVKICTGVAGVVISIAVQDEIQKHVDETVDAVVNGIELGKTLIKEIYH